MGVDEFVTYVSGVPATGAYCGTPSNVGVNFGPFLSGTVAVCGIEFSMTASCACGVPATVGSTAPASEVDGIFAKSGGRVLLGTKLHGPVICADRNQRP